MNISISARSLRWHEPDLESSNPQTYVMPLKISRWHNLFDLIRSIMFSDVSQILDLNQNKALYFDVVVFMLYI